MTAATHSLEGAHPRRWIILLAVLAASIMGPIDGSVINIAMPSIGRAFGAGMSVVSWVAMAYLLVIGSLTLTFGRLGDMIGYRRVELIGIALFAVASAVCALAPSIWILIAFRAIQAIGAGMFMAMSQAIIISVFPPSERGRALGVNGMLIAVGLALGPSLGGFLLTLWGWKAIFTINIPIGIAGFIFCYSVIPAPKETKPQNFDVTGAVFGFLALASALIVGSFGQDWGWLTLRSLAAAAFAIVSSAVFILWERRTPEPMLDLALFGNRVFAAANFASLTNFVSQAAVTFLVPFYLQQVLLMAPDAAGLVLTASPLVVLLMAPTSGALSDKLGTRWLAFAGQGIVVLAFLLMLTLGPASHPLDVFWRLALFGLGTGLFQSPNNSAVMGNVPRHRLGIGSSVLATVRNVGMVVGIAVASSVFASRSAAAATRLDATGAFMVGIRAAFVVSAIIATAGALTSLVRKDNTDTARAS